MDFEHDRPTATFFELVWSADSPERNRSIAWRGLCPACHLFCSLLAVILLRECHYFFIFFAFKVGCLRTLEAWFLCNCLALSCLGFGAGFHCWVEEFVAIRGLGASPPENCSCSCARPRLHQLLVGHICPWSWLGFGLIFWLQMESDVRLIVEIVYSWLDSYHILVVLRMLLPLSLLFAISIWMVL